MRLMLLNNLDIAGGWANGTRVRLLEHDSWTNQGKGKSQLKKETVGQKEVMHTAHTLTLDDNKEFLVRVIKDEASTTNKDVRYEKSDITQVAPKGDTGRSKYAQHKTFTQLPLTLAYALTAHKAQGLNIPKSYLNWAKMFGFGVPYTMMTRTPFEDNIYFVGAPPEDIFHILDAKDERKETPITKEHKRLKALLADPLQVSAELKRRNDCGDPVTEADMKASYADIVKRTEHHQAGVKMMLETSEGFKMRGETLMKYEDKRRQWPSLEEVLQIDADGRARIIWFSTISKGWMEHKSVDVLQSANLDEPNLCVRASTTDSNKHYIRHNTKTPTLERLPFPTKPSYLSYAPTQQSKFKHRQMPTFPTMPNADDAPQKNTTSVTQDDETKTAPTTVDPNPNTTAKEPFKHKRNTKQKVAVEVPKTKDIVVQSFKRKVVAQMLKNKRQKKSMTSSDNVAPHLAKRRRTNGTSTDTNARSSSPTQGTRKPSQTTTAAGPSAASTSAAPTTPQPAGPPSPAVQVGVPSTTAHPATYQVGTPSPALHPTASSSTTNAQHMQWNAPRHRTAPLQSYMGRAVQECPDWYNSAMTAAVNNNRQQVGSTCGLHAANHILARACDQRGWQCISFTKGGFEFRGSGTAAAIGDREVNLMQPGGSNYDIAVLHTNLMAYDIHLFPLSPQDLESKLVNPFGTHATAQGVFQSIAYLLRLPSHGGHWISLLSSGANFPLPLLCDSLYSRPFEITTEEIEQLLQASAIDAAHCSIDAFTAEWGCFLAALST